MRAFIESDRFFYTLVVLNLMLSTVTLAGIFLR